MTAVNATQFHLSYSSNSTEFSNIFNGTHFNTTQFIIKDEFQESSRNRCIIDGYDCKHPIHRRFRQEYRDDAVHLAFMNNADLRGYDKLQFPNIPDFKGCGVLTKFFSYKFFTYNPFSETCYIKSPTAHMLPEPSALVCGTAVLMPGYDFFRSFDETYSTNYDKKMCHEACSAYLPCLFAVWYWDPRRVSDNCYYKWPDWNDAWGVISGVVLDGFPTE